MEIVRTVRMGDHTQADPQSRLMCSGVLRDMLGKLTIDADDGSLAGLTALFWRYDTLSLATVYFPDAHVSLSADGGTQADIVIVRPTDRILRIQQQQEISVSPGEIVFLEVNASTRFELPHGGRLDFAHLPAHALAPYRQILGAMTLKSISPECLPVQLLAGYAGYLLRQEYQTRREARLMIEHFYALLPVVARSMAANPKPPLQERRIDTIKKMIEARLGESQLSIADVAAAEGITPRAIQKLFKHEETTFSRYLLERRLSIARDQLISTSAKTRISDIAYRVGFNDLSHFNRTFRSRYGTSPGGLRRLNVGGAR